MPTHYTGRVLTILAVMYIALISVYPRAPFSILAPLQDQPVSLAHNLRPGIDMVGGTSLIYEIQAGGDDGGAAAQAVAGGGLATEVANTLKRRVDPNGVLNLIWRPQGDDRLEIQMPLVGDSKAADAARGQYLAAQQALNDLNVAPPQVVRLAENLTGDERIQQLDKLAGESESRRETFRNVAAKYDSLQQAEASGSIPAIETARRAYAQAVAAVEATNLTVEQVQAALDATPEVREQRLQELRIRAEGFPARAGALDVFVVGYDDYQKVRGEIADTASLKRLLRGSGVLEFHIVADDLPPDELQRYYERLQSVGPRPSAGDQFRWLAVDDPENFGGGSVAGPDGQQYVLIDFRDEKSLDGRDEGWGLARASPQADEYGGRAVGFTFDAGGARLFGDLSGSNIGKRLAIVLDDRVISAPNLQSRIGGNGIITGGQGGFNAAESSYLINTLNAGALPARLSDDPISERTVGPQLGSDNLRAGLMSCAVGLVALAIFMIGYYYLAGVVATIAVFLNVLIILGAMAALNATFTLPGIAGIILSLGMAVDANVLIYERLREEQARGLSLRMALRNAYDRAFSAILDSNITTGITALVLYVFGSEEVAGFGLTLLIGIFASLFTALFVTKTIFGLLVDKFGLEDLGSLPRTFPRWNAMLNPGIDWMGKAGVFGLVSGVVIALGLTFFALAWGRGDVLDIEFAGGTTAQIEFSQPTPIAEVRDLLSAGAGEPLAGAQVVAIEPPANVADGTTYEVVVPDSPYSDTEAVTNAILAKAGDRLNLQQASRFDRSDATFEQALGDVVLPVDGDSETVAGLPVGRDALAANVGGVAIVLRDLTPMLDARALEARFNQQRLKGAYNAEGLRGGVRVAVETFPGENAAVVLVSNDRYVYDAADPAVVEQWNEEFAAPAWQLMSDAVARPAELSKVTTIGAQVAGEFARDAVIGVILSVLAIVAYVWVRFGDLRYGGATVVALIHDALFCVAAIGFAHALVRFVPGLAEFLLLDPFRLNLTMVASILTVMGFSMNDTVVVFDRIRENRGRYGVLSRGVVNDAINQTLSRTLLTSSTLIVVLGFMYVAGGAGIHGFAFAMLVGLITGTYSSIAIAAPLLLVGHAREDVPAGASPAAA